MSGTSSDSDQHIVPSTLSLGAVGVLTMVLGLSGTIIITRHFSVEDFGIFTLFLVVTSFLNQASTFDLEMSVPKFMAGAKDEISREQFFGTAVVIRIGLIVLTGLLAWFGSPLLETLFGQSLLPGFLLYVPLFYTVESFRTLLRAALQGNLLFSKMAITDLSKVPYILF